MAVRPEELCSACQGYGYVNEGIPVDATGQPTRMEQGMVRDPLVGDSQDPRTWQYVVRRLCNRCGGKGMVTPP